MPILFLNYLSYIVLFFAVNFLITFVKSDLEFCYGGVLNVARNGSLLDCPYGILFKEPKIIGAIRSDDSEFCVRKSVCSDESWECAHRLQYSEAQVIVPSRPLFDGWKIVTSDYSIDRTIPACIANYEEMTENALEIETINIDNVSGMRNLKRKKRQAVIIPPEEDKSKVSESEIQNALDEQTKRLFYYLSGINSEEVNSHLRAVQLFLKSIRLVNMICDSKYLHEEFLDNVEKAFMFLLKEQGLERITDVDVDDYILLRKALEHCMADPSGYVELIGNHCPANFYVKEIQRNQVHIPFDRTDEANFQWGRYDVTVDAAWHIIDIVHGMCFATFRENLNLHHKYEVVMEQLFNDALHHRWHTITKLKREGQYDNIFMTDVNTTMEVLDACAQGAYIGSPFLHRLNRPSKEGGVRKKRSIQEEKHEDLKKLKRNLENIAYCLKSPEEQKSKISELRAVNCPVTR